MNDTTFIFVVLPLTAGFVAFMFGLVFGRDVLNWYLKERAAQQRERRQFTPVAISDTGVTFVTNKVRAQRREKELITS
jgi:hypothetical protein